MNFRPYLVLILMGVFPMSAFSSPFHGQTLGQRSRWPSYVQPSLRSQHFARPMVLAATHSYWCPKCRRYHSQGIPHNPTPKSSNSVIPQSAPRPNTFSKFGRPHPLDSPLRLPESKAVYGNYPPIQKQTFYPLKEHNYPGSRTVFRASPSGLDYYKGESDDFYYPIEMFLEDRGEDFSKRELDFSSGKKVKRYRINSDYAQEYSVLVPKDADYITNHPLPRDKLSAGGT
jgi:hypothetical protein